MYLASSGTKADEPSRRPPVLRAPPEAPKPEPEAPREQPAVRPLRRFQLPPMRERRTEQTLLQPQFPIDVPPLKEVRLPQVFFWSPLPMAPSARIRKNFIMPGAAKPSARPPRLDAPPVLATPNLELPAGPAAQIASTPGPRPAPLVAPPASTAAPVRMLQPDAPKPPELATIERWSGDAATILALSSSPKPLRDDWVVPPGNQLGRLPGEPGQADRRGVEGATPAAGQPPAGGAGAGNPLGAAPPAPPPAPALPAPAIRVVHPVNAVFNVVVVHSSSIEGFPESAGALSGRPVYSVFLKVGGPKDWIFQYCLPGENNRATVSGGVIRLATPVRISAPYPQVTYVPKIRPRPGSHFLVHGYIDTNGRFEDLRVLKSDDAEEGRSVLPILQQWEFRPAVREGRPARVEIVLAIPR